ncbi:MAG: hypothetical protein WBB27_10450 [Maribacter sp.]
MNRIFVFLSALLTFSTLFGQKEMDLTSDSTLITFFNENEIEGLKSMVQYVDDMVFNSTKESDIDKAYHLFFEEMALAIEYKAPLEEEIKYQFLESLDSLIFNAIWRFEPHMNIIHYRDTVYRNLKNFKTLELRPFGKYINYLKEIGKDDSYFESLHKMFEDVGNLSASYSFSKDHKDFEFNIPKNRLWAAIYILRMEETYEMKLDRYFKNR